MKATIRDRVRILATRAKKALGLPYEAIDLLTEVEKDAADAAREKELISWMRWAKKHPDKVADF